MMSHAVGLESLKNSMIMITVMGTVQRAYIQSINTNILDRTATLIDDLDESMKTAHEMSEMLSNPINDNTIPDGITDKQLMTELSDFLDITSIESNDTIPTELLPDVPVTIPVQALNLDTINYAKGETITI